MKRKIDQIRKRVGGKRKSKTKTYLLLEVERRERAKEALRRGMFEKTSWRYLCFAQTGLKDVSSVALA